jgi:hypothetical protein
VSMCGCVGVWVGVFAEHVALGQDRSFSCLQSLLGSEGHFVATKL